MAIIMSTSEIVKNFKANPTSSQIQILAELNDCSRVEIIEVLQGEGIDVTKIKGQRGPKKGAKQKNNSSKEPSIIDNLENAQIKVNLEEHKIEAHPVPDYYIPDSVKKLVQDQIDNCMRLIIAHTEAIDKINREKLELEHFLKGEFKDYGAKDELFRQV